MISIQGISKQFASGAWGLRETSLQLQPGIIGLLGPNGAGKSSLMRILATVSQPSSGRITLGDIDVTRNPDELRKVLGYLPQDFAVYPHLTAVEFLEYMAALKGIAAGAARRRIQELLQLLSLGHAAKQPLASYSGGMRQRVGVAQALLNDPQVLIMDEPTTGLDPQQRLHWRNFLSEWSRNRIVILATHIVGDLESLADEIIVINQGKVLMQAQPNALLATVAGNVWEWTAAEHELAALHGAHFISNTLRVAEGVRLRAIAAEPPVSTARNVAATLEEAYLNLVGVGARAPSALVV